MATDQVRSAAAQVIHRGWLKVWDGSPQLDACQHLTLAVLLLLLQAFGDLLTLREVAQLGDVVEHGLQIVITDLALE